MGDKTDMWRGTPALLILGTRGRTAAVPARFFGSAEES